MTHAELLAAGHDVSVETHARLARFVAALLDENRRLNLTATRDPHDAWLLHVCDSLAVLPALREQSVHRVLDLGTGGGSPGIPLAIAEGTLRVTLLDSVGKKVRAAERIAHALGLANVVVVSGRAELLAHDAEHRERYDAVVARAVAPLPVLIEYAAGFVRPGGHCWFYKSRATADVAGAETAAEACAMRHVKTIRYDLPAQGPRVLLRYEKVGTLPTAYPRSPGTPRNRPL